MKFSTKNIKRLRKMVKKTLEKVEEGCKIHLEKELLETLLFDTCYEKIKNTCPNPLFAGKKVLVKFFVWSGPFLSKIDLREVSFEDVLWSNNIDAYFENCNTDSMNNMITQGIICENTNAHIDFKNSFLGKYWQKEEEGMYIPCYYFDNVHLSRTDLSNNKIKYEHLIMRNCNFSNTDIHISFRKAFQRVFLHSNLENVDLSQAQEERNDKITEQSFTATALAEGILGFFHCNLSNTKLSIHKKPLILNVESFIKEMKEGKLESYFSIMKDHEELDKLIEKGYLNGCYINGEAVFYKEVFYKKKEMPQFMQDIKVEIETQIENFQKRKKQKFK